MACRAQLNGVDAPTPEETDKHMEGIQAFAKQALAGASAAMLFTSSMEAAVAYPIFAQQNYANPREYTGKIVCANCHLASKPIEVRLPQAVLPDTIFKMEVEVPAKYAKRRQPLADGSKGPHEHWRHCRDAWGMEVGSQGPSPQASEEGDEGLGLGSLQQGDRSVLETRLYLSNCPNTWPLWMARCFPNITM